MSSLDSPPTTFIVHLRARRGIAPVRALRRGLKFLGRQCGLKCVSIKQVSNIKLQPTEKTK